MVIAVSGKQRRGKNTVTALICKYFNLIYPNQITTEFSSAYQGKLELARRLNTSIYYILENKEELRPQVIDVLEEGKKIHGEDVWIKEIEYVEADNIVVDDLRFKGEIKYLKNKPEVYYLRVERDINLLKDFKLSCEEHYSETDLDDYTEWNYVIHNNGTIEELEIEVIRILREIYANHQRYEEYCG